ncbi:DNA primase [Candidatus Peribacteria bacterium RIFCSPHIGHO2_01_FULL_55_13]|nr:MAG: DNA primase [Candidatus Peribacteria bacterium RIFCSPHIGHO2_01_FULL_55_13]OGJ65534.1 MAG: DNA primase [Candidatus Peribacteria bacterium RIFCSPHIGHO2_12_FULL_55_11]
MDPVSEIKARLPIEQLVGQYVQMKPKGRNFVSLCPFHNDKHPSFLISPDKGIAYCFACNSGGDIFSFYQKVENVDFPQAIRELAERTGVALPKRGDAPIVDKDEKEQLRSCVEAAQKFFRKNLVSSELATKYLGKRGVPAALIETFGMGYAPDSFSDTYQYLLKEGFSRKEIIAAGLGIQKELSEERIYDRFRNRLMFPISDMQGRIVAFGGRTLGEDDAKYINSSEGPIYRKSGILFGLHLAREAIRENKRVVMVEGYFDVVACHKVGITNVVAVSGTALTEEHARILKRGADAVVLCLDADRAGQEAAERAFHILSKEGILVLAAEITAKDPDEAAQADAEDLKKRITDGAKPYLDLVLGQMRSQNLSRPEDRRNALQRVLKLLSALPTAVERQQYMAPFAALFGTTETALKEDLGRVVVTASQNSISGTAASVGARHAVPLPSSGKSFSPSPFSPAEISLGLFVLYPRLRNLLPELIAPEDPFGAALYEALKNSDQGTSDAVGALRGSKSSPQATMPLLAPEHQERLSVLLLFCEQHGFHEWSENLAAGEIRRNCQQANRTTILVKQRDVMAKLAVARKEGKTVEEAQLSTQYQQILKLSKMAG